MNLHLNPLHLSFSTLSLSSSCEVSNWRSAPLRRWHYRILYRRTFKILCHHPRPNSLITTWWEVIWLTVKTFPSSVSLSSFRLWTDCAAAMSLPRCQMDINNGCWKSHYSTLGCQAGYWMYTAETPCSLANHKRDELAVILFAHEKKKFFLLQLQKKRIK